MNKNEKLGKKHTANDSGVFAQSHFMNSQCHKTARLQVAEEEKNVQWSSEAKSCAKQFLRLQVLVSIRKDSKYFLQNGKHFCSILTNTHPWRQTPLQTHLELSDVKFCESKYSCDLSDRWRHIETDTAKRRGAIYLRWERPKKNIQCHRNWVRIVSFKTCQFQ